MISVLALWSLQGMLVCLGEDGHVDIGGGAGDCCHESSDSSPNGHHPAATNGPDDCCIDIVIPTIDVHVTARKAQVKPARGPSVDRVPAAGPPAIPDPVAGDLICPPPNLPGPSPKALRTVVLLL